MMNAALLNLGTGFFKREDVHYMYNDLFLSYFFMQQLGSSCSALKDSKQALVARQNHTLSLPINSVFLKS